MAGAVLQRAATAVVHFCDFHRPKVTLELLALSFQIQWVQIKRLDEGLSWTIHLTWVAGMLFCAVSLSAAEIF